ncbi:regulatory LuxR family protein [Anseongella ginsenosidimutans]|uniref:Regulatory LuxR family protein n=2 Tax=Anseongella ginsenosidimutans TaxID=496056 RepID=A0A4R3KM08_9SPHI|nr:regulatory LuxR family protein [Anseongella ginsenosidimutans]
MNARLTDQEIADTNSRQTFSLAAKIHKGEFTIESVGDYLPGNVLVTDLSKPGTVYMNKRGCSHLKHSVEELQALGPAYFQQFFVPDEIGMVIRNYGKMYQRQDMTAGFNFVHRVKHPDEKFYKWHFASARLLFAPGKEHTDKIVLIVNEVHSAESITKKINSALDESDWMKKNFLKFCRLTRREKDIIALIVDGNSTADIADFFCISQLTVKTHRKNLLSKLEVNSFAELYKFALTYGLVR